MMRRRRGAEGSCRGAWALVLCLGGAGCDGPLPPAGEAARPAPLAESSSAAALVGEVGRRFRWSPPAAVEAFERSGRGSVAPRLRGPRARARVELPERSSGRVRVEDLETHLAVAFALDEAHDVSLEVTGGVAVYRGAAHGATVLYRTTPEGVEDLVFFERAPAREELTFTIDTDATAGLRLVSRTLELLDAAGVPRLRVAPPSILDATSRSHPATLDVRGCAADTSAAPPWGRPVTAPCAAAATGGSCRCEVHVEWIGQGVVYPALLDPQWTSTGTMATKREFAAAASLPGGDVLVTGGEDGFNDLAGTEIFHVASNSWTAGPPLHDRRSSHTATLLPDARVLVAGGQQGLDSLTSAEIFDPNDATKWTPTVGAMTGARRWHVATLLPASGKVLVTGGYTAGVYLRSAEIFDPATQLWSAAADMADLRANHTATSLPGGNVLVVGGYDNGSLETTELYDPGADTWSPGPALLHGRYNHTANLIGGGVSTRLLVAGGRSTQTGFLASVEELYPADAGAWVDAPSMMRSRTEHCSLVLPNGHLLVTGGDSKSPPADSELFDPADGGAWTDAGSLNEQRTDHVMSALPDGGALVAGGRNTSGVLDSSETWWLLSNGAACGGAGECASGACTGGVCCDSPCTGACEACTAAETGLAQDGICGPRPVSPCGAYQCVPHQPCPTHCTSKADCTTGNVCAPDMTCAKEVLMCDGDHTLVGQNSPPMPCPAPYGCSSGGCLTSCSANSDCVQGTCDQPTGHCVSGLQNGATPPACGCRAAGLGHDGAAALLGAALGAWSLARQRRRRGRCA